MRLARRLMLVLAAALATASCGAGTTPVYTASGNWHSGLFYILLDQRSSRIDGAYLCAPRSVCATSDISGTITGSIVHGVVTLQFVSSIQPLSFTGSFENATTLRGVMIHAADTSVVVLVKAPP